jgi:H+/gluconate symporter-like permease
MSLPDFVGLAGILVGLGFLIWLAYRGWSILLLAPLAAMAAALFSREPLLAHWTQTFMASAAQFVMQFFPIFLLGALFRKLMEDSGSVSAIATFMTERLGAKRAVLAVLLAGALNVLASLTGSASGGLTIALDALGGVYMKLAAEQGISPDLLHRVAVIGAGTLDSLPHNGAVVTLLSVCGSTHRESYLDIVMVAIVGALIALVAVIVLGSALGSF